MDKKDFIVGRYYKNLSKYNLIAKYVEGLFDAKNSTTLAEQALKKHQEKIAFLEAQLASLDDEVDA